MGVFTLGRIDAPDGVVNLEGQEERSSRFRERRRQQQIPFGNDRQKSKGKDESKDKGNSKSLLMRVLHQGWC
jgi:hypothetical protein